MPVSCRIPFSTCSTLEKANKDPRASLELVSYIHFRADAKFTTCDQWKFPKEAAIREGKGIVSSFIVLLV